MATTLNGFGNRVESLKIMSNLRLASQRMDVAAQQTLTVASPPLLFFAPASANQDCLLPAEASSDELVFVIVNTDDTHSIVVKEDSDTTTIATVAPGKVAIVVCDGTTWRALIDTDTDT